MHVIYDSIINKQTAKPALHKKIIEIKLNIATNTSNTLRCLLEYRNHYRPAERRHRSQGFLGCNCCDNGLLSLGELFRQNCGIWSQLLL